MPCFFYKYITASIDISVNGLEAALDHFNLFATRHCKCHSIRSRTPSFSMATVVLSRYSAPAMDAFEDANRHRLRNRFADK